MTLCLEMWPYNLFLSMATSQWAAQQAEWLC